MGRGTRILLWSLGGCGVLAVLLLVAALIFGGLAFSRMFNLQVGHISAPGDFPVYPGAKMSTGIKVGARDGVAGHSVTVVQWQVAADAERVRSWYEVRLNAADWEVVGHQARGIRFRRRSTGATALVQVTGQLSSSIIQLQMTGDQSLDPGATPTSAATSSGGKVSLSRQQHHVGVHGFD